MRNQICRAVTALLVVASMAATASNARTPTEDEAEAVYCAQSDKLALQQLQQTHANAPQLLDKNSAQKAVAVHQARIDNVERFLKPRRPQLNDVEVQTITQKARTDFESYVNQSKTCTQACKDDGCIFKCLAYTSDLTKRVESCLHRSWR